MGMVIADLLKQMSNPYFGGNGNAIAAQAGPTNAGFYPMGMVADKNRMDAGQMPAQVTPAQPSPSFDIGKLLSGLASSASGAPLASPPSGAQYDPNAKRWFVIVNGQKQWLGDVPAAQPEMATAMPSAAQPLPERPLIDQSVIENAPWYGQEAPPVQQPFTSPYAPQIDQLRQQENDVYQSMMGRQSPHRQEFPMRPGAAGLSLLAALIARAAGAKPDMIGQFGQGFLGSLQNAADTRYANQVSDMEQGMNADKLRMSMLDQQLKALLGAEDDARQQWNADRNYNENVRQFNVTNDRVMSEGEANRASRLNAAESAAIGKEAQKWLDIYGGNKPGGSSKEERNNAANQYAELTGRALPPVFEDSANYQKSIAQAVLYTEQGIGAKLDNDFDRQTFGQRVETVRQKLEKAKIGVKIDEQALQKLTLLVQKMPEKLRDDHLKAVAATASLNAAAHLAGVKANAGGFAPSSSGKETRATIANKASAIKTIMNNNSSRIGELNTRILKASQPESPDAVNLPALNEQMRSYQRSQADLKEKLSDIVGVDLTNLADQEAQSLLEKWVANPYKAISDINGGMAERVNNPPQPSTSAPGMPPTTLKDLDEELKRFEEKTARDFGKGTQQYNAIMARARAKYTVTKTRMQAKKK